MVLNIHTFNEIIVYQSHVIYRCNIVATLSIKNNTYHMFYNKQIN